jgi:hypothetical protein
MKIKATGWIAIAGVALVAVLAILAALGSRTEPLRKLVVATLADRLDSDVELGAFSVDLVPRVTVYGEQLRLRLRGTPSDVPPLIEIKSFTVHCGLLDIIRRPRRFKHVTLEGLVVNIPPGGLKKQQNPIADAFKDASAPSDPKSDKSVKENEAPIIVEELLADGALLRIIPRRANKPPKEFLIRLLAMESLGYGQKMPFKATLTNPLPKGQIETSGTFGPWQKGDPGSTPLAGRYTFTHADLGTIKGIGGFLDSEGDFAGALDRIAVRGETRTPDFSLDTSRQPVPLTTTFRAVVDGTDGDTYLENVDAKFLRTSLTAKGAVTGTKGVKGRTVKLEVQIHQGRIEDLLRLATAAKKPLMIGNVALNTSFLLPPGEADVIQRLHLDGQFGVRQAEFTDPKVQQKLGGMSQRARGIDPQDAKAENVVSDLKGTFKLKNATLSFSELSFAIPGATVQLAGDYALRSQALAFEGTLRMQATISQAAGGGVKSIFLKLIDPLFRKKGSGAVIPIRVSGTADDPKFGLDVGKVFKR